MKKALLFFLTIVLFISSAMTVFAEDETVVYVSIANGEIVLPYEMITLKDVDNDGSLTINDALYLAHEQKYNGGAAAGYASSVSAYGLKIDKLWGEDNGDSYGYYLNNASAMSLSDTLKNGDHVYAFCYTDLTNWSDTYSYFDITTSSVESGENITLTLYASGYDASWNPISLNVNGASVYVNGEKTDIKTDEQGKATIYFEKAGSYIISASSETQNLVPPVCVVNVSEKNDSSDIPVKPAEPGDISIFVFIIAAIFSCVSLSFILRKQKV